MNNKDLQTDAMAFAGWLVDNNYFGLQQPEGRVWFVIGNKGKYLSIEQLYKLFNPSGAAPQPAGPVWVNIATLMPDDWENEIIRSVGHKLSHDTSYWILEEGGFYDDHSAKSYKNIELEWLCESTISFKELIKVVIRKAWLGNYKLNISDQSIILDEQFIFNEADMWFDLNYNKLQL